MYEKRAQWLNGVKAQGREEMSCGRAVMKSEGHLAAPSFTSCHLACGRHLLSFGCAVIGGHWLFYN